MPNRFLPPSSFPALLLLGLLALLLWGQCGLLFSGSTNQNRDLAAEVSSTDSLRTSPATLYLTLSLRNNRGQKLLVHAVEGTVEVNGRSYPFSATANLHDTPLPKKASVRQAVAVALGVGADSLAALQKTLLVGSQDTNSLRVTWRVSYASQRSPEARSLAYYYSTLPPLGRHP